MNENQTAIGARVPDAAFAGFTRLEQHTAVLMVYKKATKAQVPRDRRFTDSTFDSCGVVRSKH